MTADRTLCTALTGPSSRFQHDRDRRHEGDCYATRNLAVFQATDAHTSSAHGWASILLD